ncbi:5-formyltetrahydrofolate cyclo-ligase [Liberibacter crescens BT-1]|uniref:5-formyltetrahydrofolate cyclo-ligase n=1 Tax=Liberibacter crescens (strain BT-1) TaxID=1215343 RepID=L0EUI0_LIBCB|nr:5-formyltetrahydrofolate cyclo-ligase [Liberibacter crescens]AGA65214.1 5-formyltetrahydrofolate cyclo-ligase [Liberibacter crescens BT-1]AMC13164.1 5-formyltetrahydrofolate cyclo-ligase [Liberibacter crescens]
MTPKEYKAALRKERLIIRDVLSSEEHREKSVAIAVHGEKSIKFNSGEVIAAFHPIRSEVNVILLVEKLRQKGAVLCLPVINRNSLIFRQYNEGAILIGTGFGTRGPKSNAPILNPKIILMPLAAFDSKGNRIGYGAGYYDTTVAEVRYKGQDPYLIGIAFDVQEVSFVPAEPTDIRLHAVLTESGLKYFH